jgi:GNAT superfamily N-acetyltransferase
MITVVQPVFIDAAQVTDGALAPNAVLGSVSRETSRGDPMLVTRQAEMGDLQELLSLYRHLTPDMPELSDDLAGCRWREILSVKHVAVFVIEEKSVQVASCSLITAPNLMRGATPHGFLENVVTHAGHRRQGYGREVVVAGLAEAWARGCQRVMLVTGRMHRNPGVTDFYESCGFMSGRAGLMAQRPSS